jgi:isopentenyl-diphosphate delta-isomerase
MKETLVILVDENDNQLGLLEKMEAHRKALLHRAVSVFIIGSDGEWILQKRAYDKYHSKGLWTNACCTHPLPGETVQEAANRRLMEEMGIQCDLKKLFAFVYKTKLENELTEYEYDHVFIGVSDNIPVINTAEVVDWEKISFDQLHQHLIEHPDFYTCWFKEIYQKVNAQIINEKYIEKG